MTNKERAGKLKAARELITQVAFSLDVSTTRCSNCELHKFNNYDDRKIYEQLAGIEGRLQKLSESYARKPEDSNAIHA